MKPSQFLVCAAALVAIAGCNSKPGDAATNKPLDVKPIAAPNGDWSQMVTQTPGGGFAMGNPNAKVKLLEYGSMTCPHCREFDEKGAQPLIDQYIKTGHVQWEFRNYVRDAFDLTASLIARCNGAKSFFPLTRALYKDQENWVGKIQQTPEDKLQSLQSLPPNQQFLQMATIAGFQDWAAMRGIPQAKSTQCLTDENAVNGLVQMTSNASTEFPDLPGTPTFVINGKMLDKTATWTDLEPQLRTAVGG